LPAAPRAKSGPKPLRFLNFWQSACHAQQGRWCAGIGTSRMFGARKTQEKQARALAQDGVPERKSKTLINDNSKSNQ
jgi:hypothetical protein